MERVAAVQKTVDEVNAAIARALESLRRAKAVRQ